MKKTSTARAIALGLSVSIASAMPAAVTVQADASSVSKEDTVYIMADAAGNETDTTVSSHLILDGASGSVKDTSNLRDIMNVKGDETFTDDNGTLIWDAAGQDIYYQGKTDQPAPVKVHLNFLLDGKKMSPDQLAGKSGHLKIQVQYENDADVTVDINGESEHVKSPFLMMTGIILPPDTFSNVTVDNGRIVNTGSGNVVIGYGMPGLKESLKLGELEDRLVEEGSDESEAGTSENRDKTAGTGTSGNDVSDAAQDNKGKNAPTSDDEETLDFDTTEVKQKLRDGIEDLNISDTFEIEADVTGFSLGSTYTFALSDLFGDLTTSDFLSVDGINEAMDKIKEAGTKLVDGSGELFDGTTELQDGYGKLDDGINALKDGVGELAEGSGTLKDGVNKYVDGVNSLASGVTSYVDGAEQVADGIDSLTDLQKGISELKTGLDTLNAGTNSSSDLIKGINALNSGMKQLQKAADSIDVDKISKLVQAGQGSLDAAGVDLNQVISEFDGLEKTKGEVDGLIKQIETLKGGIVQAGAAIQDKSFNGAKDGAQQVVSAVEGAGIGGQVGSAVTGEVQSKLPQSLSLSEIPSVNVDLSELSEEEAAKIQEQINAANAQISAANGQIQQAQGTYQAAYNAVGSAAGAAAEKAAGTAIANIRNGISENVTAPDFDPSNVAQLTGGLDQLIAKAQGISTKLGNVISSSSYQALKAQLPELKSTLNNIISADPVKKLGTLQTSVNQLADGTSSLKNAVDKQLVPGIQKLDEGAKTLNTASSKGISKLQSGVKKLTENDKKLKSGAKQLKSSGKKLKEGVSTLDQGSARLKAGSAELSTGSASVKDGIGQLHDGADQLHSGLIKLDEQGIQKLADLTEGDLKDLISRVKAILSDDASYSSFTGAAGDMSTTTKFVIETAAIE